MEERENISALLHGGLASLHLCMPLLRGFRLGSSRNEISIEKVTRAMMKQIDDFLTLSKATRNTVYGYAFELISGVRNEKSKNERHM